VTLARARVVVVALALSACATANAPVPAVPAASPSTVERLVEAHRKNARALEQTGDLRRALDAWKIALTIAPDDAAAREGRARVEKALEDGVTTRVRLGQEALRRGSYLEARRHLLAALALDPGNKVAFTALRDDVKELRSVPHTVARGETLGSIAERYYGDRARAEVIWETNKLPANPRLAVGTRLMIPEIPGIPFNTSEPRPAAPAAPAAPTEAAPPTVRESLPPTPREEVGTTEIHPLLADAREARERKEYPAAIAAIDRLLEESPRNAEWVDFKKATLYDYAKSSLDGKQYDDAYRASSQLTRLDPRYKDVAGLQRQARTRAIEAHYNEGIRLYRDEKLESAIAHWRIVLEYDANHAEAKRNIEQAERLLKVLDERQRR
jgi:tetratricopeptide (TPR) repeat protein